jgi:hypothetical protein
VKIESIFQLKWHISSHFSKQNRRFNDVDEIFCSQAVDKLIHSPGTGEGGGAKQFTIP